MGPRYADIRCPRPRHKDTDYCKLHNKRLEEYEYLLFGRYDEPRPRINVSHLYLWIAIWLQLQSIDSI